MKNSKRYFIVALFISLLFGISKAQDTNGGENKNIKITFRPSPVYTNIARKNNIEGKVFLKVKFLANGTIGSITDATEDNAEILREYGLINKAIEAAKKLKFEPAIRNGKPVSMVKTVVFDFRLY